MQRPPRRRKSKMVDEPFNGKKVETRAFLFGLFLLISWCGMSWRAIYNVPPSSSGDLQVSLLLEKAAMRRVYQVDISVMMTSSYLADPVTPTRNMMPRYTQADRWELLAVTWEQIVPVVKEPQFADILPWDLILHSKCMWVTTAVWKAYYSFCKLRLLLSHDIESNPGPDVITDPHVGSLSGQGSTSDPSVNPPNGSAGVTGFTGATVTTAQQQQQQQHQPVSHPTDPLCSSSDTTTTVDESAVDISSPQSTLPPPTPPYSHCYSARLCWKCSALPVLSPSSKLDLPSFPFTTRHFFG